MRQIVERGSDAEYGGQEHNGKRGKILRLLWSGDEVSALQLAQCSLQYQARLFELREAGFDVRKVREENVSGIRHCYYRLFHHKPQATPPEPAASITGSSSPSQSALFQSPEPSAASFVRREMGVTR